MAAASFYKFVNPRGLKSPGMTIAGTKYANKSSDTGRTQILALNRIGGQLNEQSKILSGIKKSIDDGIRATIINAKLVNKSIQGLAAEDRKRKIEEVKERNRLLREARIRASRARLGAKEDRLEAKSQTKTTSTSEDETPESGGFRNALGKFLKTLFAFAAIKWLSNPENARLVANILTALVKVAKVIYKIVEFGVVSALEGFTNIFSSDSNIFDRLKGFLKFAVGIFSLFLVNRYLKNPLKLIKDARRLFKVLRVIPKALSLAAKAGKALVMATRMGVARMRGGGVLGKVLTGAAVVGGTALTINALSGSDNLEPTSTPAPTPPAPTPTAPTVAPAKPVKPDISMASGGIVPFMMPSAQSGARIIKGRNSGYNTIVGGRPIEAHGAEAVIPLKNRYTDSGNDPLAAVLGNSKKMAEAMGSLITLPLKIAGGGIVIGLGTLLGMAPFGIGTMLSPVAKTLAGPILETFGIPKSLLDQAMGKASKPNAGAEFGNLLADTVKEWFRKILPNAPATSGGGTGAGGGTAGGGTGTGAGTAGTGTGTATGTPGGDPKSVLDLIASVESNGSYDVFNTSSGRTEGKATDKTIGWLAQNARGAIGRYQHMPSLILDRARRSGFDANTKFTPDVQDKITIDFLNNSQHRMQDWIDGKISNEDFAARLAPTWRGLPQGPSGPGGNPDLTYQDQYASRNKAHKTWDATIKALAQIKGQRMNHGGIVQRMFLGGIGKAISSIGQGISNFMGSGVGKILGTVASVAFPAAAPIIGAVSGLASMAGGGNPLGAITSGLGMLFPGMSEIFDVAGGAIGGFMSGNPLGGFGQILAQGGEMIFGPGFTQLFGGTLDMLNVAGKGLGASTFLKNLGLGVGDFAVGQLAGAMGGPDQKSAFVPGGSTVLNVNAVKMISALMKAQQVQQNTAKIQALEGVSITLGDKLVKVTGDVIAGVLADKGKMSELPPQVAQEGMAQILPLIQQAIINASQQGAQQASLASGAGNTGLQKSASGSNLSSTVAGSIGSLAGKVLGGGIK